MNGATAKRHFRFPIGRFEIARRKLFSQVMERLGFETHVVLAQGVLFVVGTTDLIDRSLAHFGIWEGEQLEDLAQVCVTQNADRFLDIGANAGVYSVMFAARGLVPQVLAFEPDPGNYAHLMANLHVNRLAGRVKTFPVAIGSSAGTMTLMEAGAHNRGESWIVHPDQPPEEAAGVARHEVSQIRFDDEFAIAGETLVIKMDVEGSEFHALNGMERTLRDNRCYLQVELYSDRIEELKALFSGLGYRYLKTEYIDHFFTNIEAIR